MMRQNVGSRSHAMVPSRTPSGPSECREHPSKRSAQRGSVLFSVAGLLLLSTFAVLTLTNSLFDYSRMQSKARDEQQAYYAAEAGALEVVSWFNTNAMPLDHLGQSHAQLASLFKRDPESGEFTTIHATLTPGMTIPVGQDAIDQFLILRNTSGTVVGSVTSLEIFYPDEPLPVPIPRLICGIRSVGACKGGRKIVIMYVADQALRVDGTPGVIVSRAGVELGGTANAHWGEVWAKDNLILSNLDKLAHGSTTQDDPWLKFRAEGKLLFNTTWSPPLWGLPSLLEVLTDPYLRYLNLFSPGNYSVETTAADPWQYPLDNVAYENFDYKFSYTGDVNGVAVNTPMMQQYQTLRWPNYPYQTIKEIAQKRGRYFGVDSRGNLYRDGVKDPTDPRYYQFTDLRELNHPDLSKIGTTNDDGSLYTWDDLPYDVVFIDTLDGNPPAADFSNMLVKKDIALQGGGLQWKGLYYICHDVTITGSGSGSLPARVCPDPAGAPHGLNIFLDGMMIVQGQFTNNAGDHVIYGSLYAEFGYSGTGGLDVYYNPRLKFGFPVPIENAVDIALFKVEG